MHEFNLDTILKPSKEILIVSGVVVSMIGELTAYGLKMGKNQKYTDSMDRLIIISDFLESCNKVNDHNYQLRYILRNSIVERNKQQQEIDELRSKLESITNAFNAGE